MIDTNVFELAVIICSSLGFVVQWSLLRDARRNLKALGVLSNGRRRIARAHVMSAVALLFAHGVLLYYGVRLSTTVDPPAFTVVLIVNFAFFAALPFVLLLVGLNDLRVRRQVRQVRKETA